MPKTNRFLLVGSGLLAASCVTVAPTQRQELAKPEMSPPVDVREEIQHAHVEAARQGGMGAHGVAAGGCGCG
jgi:hypothetical protein